jgi:glycosyltransferase involved in cell wall biosynthesis
MYKEAYPFVSIIIPVFNDPQRLKICLQALEVQTYPQNLYEVIVVDNGSDHPIEPVVGTFAQARAEYERKPGSYAARNKGISTAKGTVLAFTDADCIPPSDWIEKGVINLLRTPGCGIVAGPVRIFVSNPVKPTIVELHESLMAFPKEQHNEKLLSVVTANVFTFKHVVESAGPFNAELKSIGDKEWAERVFSHGYQIVYTEDVYVAHPARRSLRELYQRSVRIAGGFYDKRKYQRSPIRIAAGLLWSWVPPIRKTGQMLTDTRLKGFEQRLKFIFLEFLMNYAMALERVRLTFGASSKRS